MAENQGTPKKPGEVPDVDEIRRQALQRLRELKAKGYGPKTSAPKPSGPSASPELWPGGPSVDTGDILLARRVQARRSRNALA